MPRAERHTGGGGEEPLLAPPVPIVWEPARDPHACRSRCGCCCELGLVCLVSFGLFWGWAYLCACTSPGSGDLQRKVHDVVVSTLPAVLRALLITPLAEKVLRWVTGYQSEGMSFFATLLLGGGNADGAAASAGWAAIVGSSVLGDAAVVEELEEVVVAPPAAAAAGAGGDQQPQRRAQSSWAEARGDRGLTERQAVSSSVTKLFLWHWIQPVPYLFVLHVFWNSLDYGVQRVVGSIVAVREMLYLGATLLACASCPSFLLLDPFTLWNEATTRADRWVRLLAYLLTPHNYVVLCLANRFRSRARLFVMVGAVQVMADFASCYALFDLLTGIIVDAKQAKVQPGVPVDGAAHHPTALVCGYAITAAGFLLFWGPLSVIQSAGVALDRSKRRAQRVGAAGCGCALGVGVLYALLGFVLLAIPMRTDILCIGYVPGMARPNCEQLPVPGTCAAGLCQFKAQTLTGHRALVYALALDPTNHMLFSGSDDGTIKVWSVADGAYREEQTLTGQNEGG
eukprot:COSAG02_NODE_29_length_51136_cov_346.293317_14_plen_512_part_00